MSGLDRRLVRRTAAFLAACAVSAGMLLTGGKPASAVEGGQPAILQFGDSYSSGEGGGWKGNSNNSSGNRSGTDMAAYLDGGRWRYDPHRVYDDAALYNDDDSWADGCHVALDAPVNRLKTAIPGEYVALTNVACSGAHNKHLWLRDRGGVPQTPSRLTQLEYVRPFIHESQDVRMVVIGAGGNDAGFGAVIRACLTAWGKKHVANIAFPFEEERCFKDVWDNYLQQLTDVPYNLHKTIEQLKDELAASGQPVGSYRIVLTGYPMIVPTEADDWSYSEGSLASHCYINREDAKWINENYVPRLNQMVRAIADEKGVGFIDPSEAFVGHRLCEYGTVRGAEAAASSAHAEWVRFVDVHLNAGSLWDAIKVLAPPNGHWPLYDEEIVDILNPQRHVSESFHPNYYGQQALGKCLSLYFSGTSGAAKVKCANGGGQSGTTEQMVISTLPATPTFTDNPNPDRAIPQDGSWMWRTVTVPASVPPNNYVRLYLDINHARKGQLKISLVDPLGYGRLVRDCNPNDTGAFADGTWTFDVPIPQSPVFPRRDPSGTWKLGISECANDTHSGTLRSWNVQMY